MKNFIYTFILPFVVSYLLTYLSSLFLLNKATSLVSKSKPELEGFHSNKETIPNVGGLAFISSTIISTLIFAQFSERLVFMLSAIFCFALLGFIDDYYKKNSDNGDGIKSLTKLVWQFVISTVFITYGTHNNYIATGLFFLNRDSIFLILLENGLMIFLLVYFVNAFNITDGLDGLAGYVSLPLCILLILIGFIVPDNKIVLILNFSILGGVLAFLRFNKYPAKYFMGDCGSMSLGATLLLIAFSLKISSVFIIASMMVSIELVSSLIQIIAIRVFNKKVFSIAPIHHMYEKQGKSEVNIVSQFTRISTLFSILALMFFCYFKK